MSLTVETICDNVLLELGFGTQSAYAAASTDAGKRVFALLNREARQFSRHHWQQLKKIQTFTMSTGDYDYALASDWRYPLADTAWDDSGRRVDFPVTDEEWGYLTAQSITTGVRYKAMIRAGELNFNRIVNGDTVDIAYVSDHPWQATGGGSTKARATADTDVWLLDDEAVQLGLKWRLLKAQGYDEWQTEFQEYQRYVSHLKGTEAGAQTILAHGVLGDNPINPPYADLWDDG